MKELIEKMDGITKGIAGVAENVETLKTGQAEVVKTQTALGHRMTAVESKVFGEAYSLPGSNEGKDKDKFSFSKAIYAINTGQWEHAQFEKEIFDQMRKKQMSTGTGSAGYLVPEQQMTQLIEMLRANTVVMQMGATVLSGLVGSPVSWPRQLTGATAYWVGENAAITPSVATVGQLTMTPKKVAALVKMSNELSLLSNPSAEAMVRRDIALALALAIDLAALRGSGNTNQPLGIANTPSINTFEIGNDGGVFSWDHANGMEGVLDDDNALRGNLGFVMNPKTKRLLKRQKVAQFSGDTGGQYVVLPTISDTMLRDLLGYDFGTTTQIPVNLTKGGSTGVCSEVYFANWSELLIGMWSGLEIAASNVAGDSTGGAFSSDQLWIRAIQRMDLGLRHLESFCLCSDAVITGA